MSDEQKPNLFETMKQALKDARGAVEVRLSQDPPFAFELTGVIDAPKRVWLNLREGQRCRIANKTAGGHVIEIEHSGISVPPDAALVIECNEGKYEIADFVRL